jgi:hypothetical protein
VDTDLLDHHVKAAQLKKEIFTMKKALHTAYDVEGIIKFENELKNLQREADSLESILRSLKKVETANQKAMKELDADLNIAKTFKKGKSSLFDLRQEVKQKTEEMRTLEKAVKDEHQQLVLLEEKCRKVSTFLRDHNRGMEAEGPAREFDDKEILELEIEIENLEKKRVDDEIALLERARKQKAESDQAEEEYNEVAVKLKEKDQECRLNELKIRQLRRGIPHKTLRPLVGSNSKTHYNSHASLTRYKNGQLNTARAPFKASEIDKAVSRTHLKVSKKKLPSVKRNNKMKINKTEVVLDEPKENNLTNVEMILMSPTSSSKRLQSINESTKDHNAQNETENIKSGIKHKKLKMELVSPTSSKN